MKDIIGRLRVLTEDASNSFDELTSELTNSFREYILENIKEVPEASHVEFIFKEWYLSFDFVAWFNSKFNYLEDVIKFVMDNPEVSVISSYTNLNYWNTGDDIFRLIMDNIVNVLREWANENLPELVESWVNDLNTLDSEIGEE